MRALQIYLALPLSMYVLPRRHQSMLSTLSTVHCCVHLLMEMAAAGRTMGAPKYCQLNSSVALVTFLQASMRSLPLLENTTCLLGKGTKCSSELAALFYINKKHADIVRWFLKYIFMEN